MFEGIPEKVKTIATLMINEPSLRRHILLIGPPGSGKTTSAKMLVEAFYGSEKSSSFHGRALFLNSSDERGLEAVRSRIYPFIRSSLHILFRNENDTVEKPKIIIFDEAETLTEQAQMAVRPLLDEDPNKIMILFLCNSISKIHTSILHKFIIIQLESSPPEDFNNRYKNILQIKEDHTISKLDILFRRGDIRYFLLNPDKKEECFKLWGNFMSAKSSEITSIITICLKSWMLHDLSMFFFFMTILLKISTVESTREIIRYTDSDFLRMCPQEELKVLLSRWFQKYVIDVLDIN